VGDHPEIIPVEFGQIPNSGLGEEVVPNLPDIIQYKSVIPGVNFDPGAYFEQLW